MKRTMFWVMVTGVALLSAYPVRAQAGKNADPLYGQSQEQEARDHWECHKQAVEQTGYDPSVPQDHDQESSLGRAASQGKAVTGGTMKEAAGGAAVGAAVGAVTGNAGRGAAMGAAGGGISGLLSGLGAAWEGEQDPQDHQRWQAYQRVLAACMEVRGYSVK
jgi:hypothetical protein